MVSVILMAGYFPGILAHYALLPYMKQPVHRTNPGQAEAVIVLLTWFVALATFAVLLLAA
jgi:hypothetical protein